jgi:hypothetical protein
MVQPAIPSRKAGPAIIKNVCSVGTCDYNEFWPNGPAQTIFNYDHFYVVCFNIGVNPSLLYNRSVVKLGSAFYGPNGTKIIDEEITPSWQNNYDRMAKTFCIRGGDGSVVRTGRYRVEFWVDESIVYESTFSVTSNAELMQQRNAVLAKAYAWRNAGLCQYCGGAFDSRYGMRCINCGAPKDY